MPSDGLKIKPCHAAGGLLALVVLLLALAVLVPWWSKMRFYDAEIAAKSTQLERFQAMVARRPVLEAELNAAKRQLQRSNFYITADTPALAAAELQKKVKQIIESRGGHLVSTQNVDAFADEGPLQLAIRVRMTGDTPALTKVLYELENTRPLLFLDNLTLRTQRRVSGRGRNRTYEMVLDATFDLIAFLREQPE